MDLRGASGSEKDKSPLNEKSAVEDVSFGNLDFKQTLNLLDEDSVSKKPENISHESQEKKRYDICHISISKAVKLKPPTAVINREKRNQLDRSKQGQNIIMLRSGMVLMKGYISFIDQVSIVKKCKELGLSDGGFYQPGYHDGTKLHLKMMCHGKNWDPESKLYSDTRPSDNVKPPGIHDIFSDMVKKAIRDSNTYLEEKNPKAYAGQLIPSMSPDICIISFYTVSVKLGLHQMERCALGNLRLEEGVMFVQWNRGSLLLTVSFTAGKVKGDGYAMSTEELKFVKEVAESTRVNLEHVYSFFYNVYVRLLLIQ